MRLRLSVLLFAFYTVEFGTSVVFRSLIMSAAAAVFIVASLVAGKIAGRGGAKTLAVVGALGNGVFMQCSSSCLTCGLRWLCTWLG